MTIELTESQGNFFESEHRNSAFVGGYGSGKTFVGILKIVTEKLRLPGTNMAYYMPTYPLIRDVAFPRISEVFDELDANVNGNIKPIAVKLLNEEKAKQIRKENE